MIQHRGYLALIGGAEEKEGSMEVLSRVVGLNSPEKAIVIPTASDYPYDLGERYYYLFRDLGVKDVFVFDIRHRDEADTAHYHEKIEGAGIIFLTGGDQVKLVNILDGSNLMQRIRQLHSQGATLAGTSAGAAAASEIMIYGGDDEGLSKGAVNYTKGFAFLKGITVDTHFSERNRLARLSQFLAGSEIKKGLGLDENTAMIIGPDMKGDVIGSGSITVVDSDGVNYSNLLTVEQYDPITLNGIKIGFLPAGARFDLERWMVEEPVREMSRLARIASNIFRFN
ncbi:MAG: cyanophycinase [Bacteroidetes bacterium]|nr:cyanophycinase [Bacteroidota bacterium]